MAPLLCVIFFSTTAADYIYYMYYINPLFPYAYITLLELTACYVHMFVRRRLCQLCTNYTAHHKEIFIYYNWTTSKIARLAFEFWANAKYKRIAWKPKTDRWPAVCIFQQAAIHTLCRVHSIGYGKKAKFCRRSPFL